MSMSSHVTGVRDLDGKFADMINLKLACEKARIDYPPDLKAYLKYPAEDVDYLRREMESVDISAAVKEYTRNATDGFEVDLSKLPKECKAIRFENSY
jgi:hypothetical protein